MADAVIVFDVNRSVATFRVLLSLVALTVMSVDATWTGGAALPSVALALDQRALLVVSLHLAYSLLTYFGLTSGRLGPTSVARITPWGDVTAAAAIAACSAGASSLSYAFFTFALAGVGFQSGLRRTLIATTASLVLYFAVFALLEPSTTSLHAPRPLDLVIIGYLVGHFGQRRLDLETRIAALAAAKERTRIACDLHDGCVQTLAAISLHLAGCRERLRAGGSEATLADLAALQASVSSESDNLRAYMRRLAGREQTPQARKFGSDTQFSVEMLFKGSAATLEQVLHILRESVANVQHHAGAPCAAITVRTDHTQVLIDINDEGVGLRNPEERPWSIASRVSDLGGRISVAREGGPGTHFAIALPRA